MTYDDFLNREISRHTDGERAPEPPIRQTVAVIDWRRRLLAECAITSDAVEVDRIDRVEMNGNQNTIPPAAWAHEGIDALALSDLRALARETWEGLHA